MFTLFYYWVTWFISTELFADCIDMAIKNSMATISNIESKLAIKKVLAGILSSVFTMQG